MHVETTYTIELDLDIAGNRTRRHAATNDDPAEGGHVEDIDIARVGYERTVRKLDRETGTFMPVRMAFDLLKGLDKAAREIVIANLIEAVGEDALAAELEEGGE